MSYYLFKELQEQSSYILSMIFADHLDRKRKLPDTNTSSYQPTSRLQNRVGPH